MSIYWRRATQTYIAKLTKDHTYGTARQKAGGSGYHALSLIAALESEKLAK